MTTAGFSTERYCPRCDTTKDWKAYYADQGMCRACYRDYLARAVWEDPIKPHHSKVKHDHMGDLLTFLDKVAASNDLT